MADASHKVECLAHMVIVKTIQRSEFSIIRNREADVFDVPGLFVGYVSIYGNWKTGQLDTGVAPYEVQEIIPALKLKTNITAQ